MDERQVLMDAIESGSSLVLIGRSGCGKTTLCESVFAELDVRFHKPCYETINNHKDFEYLLQSFFQVDHLDDRKKVMFLDDVDVLLTNNRYASTFLCGVVSKFCIVMTSCISEEKRLTEMKKLIPWMRMSTLSLQAMTDKFAKAYPNIELSKIETCILRSNSNLWAINRDLQSYTRSPLGAPTDCYFDTHIIETSKLILDNHDEGTDELQRALAYDPTVISLIIKDNYKAYMNSTTDDAASLFHASKRVGEAYCMASELMHHAQVHSEWDLIDNAALISVGTVRMFMTGSAPDDFAMGYTQIPTRAAQHYNTRRCIAQHTFDRDTTISDFETVCEVMYETGAKIPPGSIASSYSSNICSRLNRPYDVNVSFRRRKA